MFFHTHVYYSKRVDSSLDSLKVVGSILPDLALTSLITWDDLHKKRGILDFSTYEEKSNPELSSLLRGINYHNTLDYFTHLSYKNKAGYAYQSITPELTSLVGKALGVSQERAFTSSHNCIESGVEYFLLQDDPSLVKLVKDSLRQIDNVLLAKTMAEFYKKPQSEMLNGINKLFSFATDYDFTDINGLTRLFIDLNKYYLNVDVDKGLINEIINLSFALTKDTYKEFMETVIASKETEIKDSN
ncbi:MAG: hypothetical protein UR81_C0035G0003 [Candidatus Levybacteria bacterium GW2011_GWB1_35_5]|nr:MAG: hypothetical protein UR81_C0035G0003 [Candidatus Levybacteria bacterium GW2011_GWB1_35_5]